MTQEISEILRRYVVDGVPSSGFNRPSKSELLVWGTFIEGLATSALAGTQGSAIVNAINISLGNTGWQTNSIQGVPGVAGPPADLRYAVKSDAPPVYQNAVRNRFNPSVPVPNNNVSYWNGQANEQLRGDIIRVPSTTEIFNRTGCSYYYSASRTINTTKNPAIVEFVSRDQIEEVVGTITGSSNGGVAPDPALKRVSLKFGYLKDDMIGHDEPNINVGFGLVYGAASPGPSISILPDVIRFDRDETTNANGWGEGGGQPSAPDATFWADGHTAGVNDDGLVVTYYHNDVVLPDQWGAKTFQGIVFFIQGEPDGSVATPRVSIINEVVTKAGDIRGENADNYYLQYHNVPDDLPNPINAASSAIRRGLFVGDSHSDPTISAHHASIDNWTNVVALDVGFIVDHNIAVSGEQGHQQIERLKSLSNIDADFAAIYIGSNSDADDATITASPTVNSAILSDTSDMREGGYCLINGQRVLLTSKVGSSVSWYPDLDAAPALNDKVEIDIAGNIVYIAKYLRGKGVSKILVLGQHYRDRADGLGDVTDVTTNEYTPRPPTQSVRDRQKEGALEAGVRYLDLGERYSERILAGVYNQGDEIGYVAVNDSHMDRTGQREKIAEFVLEDISAAGWR